MQTVVGEGRIVLVLLQMGVVLVLMVMTRLVGGCGHWTGWMVALLFGLGQKNVGTVLLENTKVGGRVESDVAPVDLFGNN